MTESRHYYYHFRHSPSELSKHLAFYIHAMGWVAYPRTFSTVRKADSFYGYQLQYVSRGKGFFIWIGTKYHVGPDDLLFFDLTQEHAYYSDPEDPWELVWIHLGGEQAKMYLSLLEHRKSPIIRMGKNELIKHWCQDLIYLFSLRPIGLELMAALAITRMLTEISVASMSGDSEKDGSRPSQLASAHGVQWDPKNQLLWAPGYEYLVSLEVGGTDDNPTLCEKVKVALPTAGGRDLQPVYGDTDRLWVTTNKTVYQYIKFTNTFDIHF
ncbi:DUF6528 family protein [Paenibacillus allorhizosphaerae]|uniref:AraC-type arabinose-binding/dimerisation domain-containing protein n=1 Tax=Paenibacillus allorhizosphaerae TaxID=2849866 RepID=A0ABM8VAQ0_9BACL|nr:DUF6528 family protein [Paenibacillus allorhizosphaerae]CAG7617169.1 hypothetical protein PAECIP111802_00374 [Paenibacillus allorhizosphaerae]